ncbi:hypothetical protein [Ruminococcus flavefaciens]|uniref:hypothetical protein n=1 Tax=Ruminococcus flavefaciens TaxID=1265 RepID=UPI0026F3689D|nr:hypothetical protein [Ruminococcus flavefaciens]
MTEYERGFIDGVKSKVEAELTPTIIKMTDGLFQTIQEAVKTVIGNVKITAHEPASGDQPVKRGYWKDIMMSEATGWDLSLTGGRDAVLETVCSVCGGGCAFDGDGEALLSQYCPDCGAKMIKDGEHNEVD